MNPIDKDKISPEYFCQPKFVLFMDVLGFRNLTENNELQLELIQNADRPLSFDWLKYEINPLTQIFNRFHRSLQTAVQFARMDYPLTAISFSDSAFIATSDPYRTAKIGVDLMQMLIRHEVPIRASIAYGTFEAVRFRSDVETNSAEHASHFLGTGVTKSHSAESCGIKGMRILVDPSVMKFLKDKNPKKKNPKSPEIGILDCSGHECQNKQKVTHEINYWNLKPTEEKETWRSFQDMWKKAPSYVDEHYRATAEAINRMRISFGKKPIKNLKRRTLPKE